LLGPFDPPLALARMAPSIALCAPGRILIGESDRLRAPRLIPVLVKDFNCVSERFQYLLALSEIPHLIDCFR
jgi:hypothetical protein